MNNPLPEQAAVDARIKLYKAVAGVLPGGSFIVEYLIDHVPGQRAERLFTYIEQLNLRLEQLESLEFTKTYEYAALVENSIIEATKPVSQERLRWIASIVVPSITPTEREIEFRRRALQILTDLSDNDVQYLLAQADFSTAFQLERSMSGRHSISMADAKNLPAQDLFLKRLDNAQLELHRDALAEKRLLVAEEERRVLKYRLSELGRLFLFVLGGEHSVC
jgi:hypothetical protein